MAGGEGPLCITTAPIGQELDSTKPSAICTPQGSNSPINFQTRPKDSSLPLPPYQTRAASQPRIGFTVVEMKSDSGSFPRDRSRHCFDFCTIKAISSAMDPVPKPRPHSDPGLLPQLCLLLHTSSSGLHRSRTRFACDFPEVSVSHDLGSVVFIFFCHCC